MTRYAIALTLLGLKNHDVVFLLTNYPILVKDAFLTGSAHAFTCTLDLLPYLSFFSDASALKKALSGADRILENNGQLRINTTYYTASDYPAQLSEIPDPPAVIYYKGASFSDMPDKSVACAGTRNPSSLSYSAVSYLIPDLVHEGCSIISGLALGVDTLSHRSCLLSGGRAIAVLAHGLDMVYPSENAYLAERILSSGGILMSEYPVAVRPEKHRFIQRNRLITGMSRAVIIFECGLKSGSMHTARYALSQNRPIFCPSLKDASADISPGTRYLAESGHAFIINGRFDYGFDYATLLKTLTSPNSGK